MNEDTYFPGTRLMIFTPRSITIQAATVIRWYGRRSKYGIYPSLVDVKFDNDDRESIGHFADSFYVTIIDDCCGL